MKKYSKYIVLAALILILASCTNEFKNKFKRGTQSFQGVEMNITLYSLDGTVIFEGDVKGKVTRASTDGSGHYIYWYDTKGQYHQTSLPYLLVLPVD